MCLEFWLLSMPRKCKSHPDSYCYVCGRFTTIEQRVRITSETKQIYQAYFGCKLGDQDKPWAPHIMCKSCSVSLKRWFSGKLRSMQFAVPMIWWEPTNHATDCYFCMTNVKGINKKDSIRISVQWKGGIRDDGMSAWWPTTAGLWSVAIQHRITDGIPWKDGLKSDKFLLKWMNSLLVWRM